MRNTLLAVALCFTALLPRASAAIPGRVEAWGDFTHGKTTPPAGLDGVIAIAGGVDHSLALRTNGLVVAWGDNSIGQTSVPAGLSNVIAIAAATHSVALKNDGTVAVWGDPRPQVTLVPQDVTDVIAIAAGGNPGGQEAFTVALRRNGTVAAWGAAFNGQTNVPANLTGVIAIDAGTHHALALTRARNIVGWGLNASGSLHAPAGLTGAAIVRAGQYVSGAVTTNGTLYLWGEPAMTSQFPASLSNVVDVQFGNVSLLALRSDGALEQWGQIFDGTGPGPARAPAGLGYVTTIASGANHSLAVAVGPRITSVSPSIVAAPGQTVTFSVTAQGNNLSYQWRRGGQPAPGETNASIRIPNAQPAHAGVYTVAISDQLVTIISLPVSLTFPPPTIVEQPQSFSRIRGETAVLRTVVSGSEPILYSWQKNGVPIPGATNSALTITNLQSSHAGTYQAWVSDLGRGETLTAPAELTVIDPTVKTLVFTPAVDLSINSSGANPQVNTLLAGRRANGALDRALIRFDLSSIPADAVISSAALQLRMVKQPGAGSTVPFAIHRLLQTWDATAAWSARSGGIPWQTAGGETGTDFLAQSSSVCDDGYRFPSHASLLADLQLWREQPAENHGWLLKADNEGPPRSAKHFGSLENGSPPELAIVFVVPASAPRIRQLATTSNLIFQFEAEPGRVYYVQQSEDLAGSWNSIMLLPAGAATAPLQFSLPLGRPKAFFRLAVE